MGRTIVRLRVPAGDAALILTTPATRHRPAGPGNLSPCGKASARRGPSPRRLLIDYGTFLCTASRRNQSGACQTRGRRRSPRLCAVIALRKIIMFGDHIGGNVRRAVVFTDHAA